MFEKNIVFIDMLSKYAKNKKKNTKLKWVTIIYRYLFLSAYASYIAAYSSPNTIIYLKLGTNN